MHDSDVNVNDSDILKVRARLCLYSVLRTNVLKNIHMCFSTISFNFHIVWYKNSISNIFFNISRAGENKHIHTGKSTYITHMK